MSSPQSTGNPFSYDQTLKSLFAERDVVRDLLDFHAADLFPDLQGFEPLELVSASTVTADATSPPHHEETHRDTVWTLARKGDDRDRVLLHLEFQSQRDPACPCAWSATPTTSTGTGRNRRCSVW